MVTEETLTPVAPRRLDTAAGPVWLIPLDRVAGPGLGDLGRLPVTIRILLEMQLRHLRAPAGPQRTTTRDVRALLGAEQPGARALPFLPTRVLLQDHSGLPALVDLAAMRSVLERQGRSPAAVESVVPVDLVIDHSVEVQHAGSRSALPANLAHEYERNHERYRFLRWAQQAFTTLRVVPPGQGIVHQVHLEHLARVIATERRGDEVLACPDTVVGTDSHTPMINALGVLGWGVGGIEAEAVMLGHPVPIRVPAVVGVRLVGERVPGVTATDLVLTLTQLLRQHGVVGRMLEFFGEGAGQLAVHDRATIANMCPEYGATTALFPIDDRTLEYLAMTRRDAALNDLVERYAKAQGLFRSDGGAPPVFADVVELDLSRVEPCVAGPSRPQDRVRLADVPRSFSVHLAGSGAGGGGGRRELAGGDVVIAAITSCTNTSNPASMLAAGLLARNAVRRGLRSRPWVKTSMAPGSRVVTRYLAETGLLDDLEHLGFHVVGYGCTTCIGNSGPLHPDVARAIAERDVATVAVLSGNRNFEGRIHPAVRGAYLASPPLVVAWALAGSVVTNLVSDPLGVDAAGAPVMLADLWPAPEEVDRAMSGALRPDLFADEYRSLFDGDERWHTLSAARGPLYPWDPGSTYIVEPPFFRETGGRTAGSDLLGARVLVYGGDTLTTDHISPAGQIPADSPAGRYLRDRGVPAAELGSYGGRRGNHEVLVRGTFSNPRLRNRLVNGRVGGWTRHFPSGEELSVFDAARRYAEERVPLVVVGGREYGMGSSRDWAAKGPRLLGIRAVLAQGFERIHRSNLVGMGIVPLQFLEGESADSLGLDGSERIDVLGVGRAAPGDRVRVRARHDAGGVREFDVVVRVDSDTELDYLRRGGVLPMALDEVVRLPAAADDEEER